MALRLDQLQGLLAGGNPLFDFGIGLLGASSPRAGGVGFGEAVAQAQQFAQNRQQQALQLQAMRESMLQRQRQQQAQEQIAGLLGQQTIAQAPPTAIRGPADDPLAVNVDVPGRLGMVPTIQTPEGQQQLMGLLAQADPAGFTSQLTQGLLGQMLATQQARQIGESPIGKMLADLEVAEMTGNREATQALRQAIQQELGEEVDLSEVRSFRNDVIRNSSEFITAQEGFDRVRVGATSGTAAGDLALIFGFMKILDPQSVVREGEFALAETAAGVPAQIRALYNRLLTGERLTPEQRADFLSQAQAQFQVRVKQHQRLVEDARGFAERNNLPLADVVPEFVMPQAFEPIELEVPESEITQETRSLRSPLTQREREELNRLRRQFGLGGD